MSSVSISGLGSFRQRVRTVLRLRLPRFHARARLTLWSWNWPALAADALVAKFVGDTHWFDAQLRPPRRFFRGAMHFSVMRATERHCKFVADFTTKRLGLGKTEVVGVGWLPAAYQARLAGGEWARP